MLMYTLALLATCCAVVTDLRTRTIPNAIPGVLFLAAGALTALVQNVRVRIVDKGRLPSPRARIGHTDIARTLRRCRRRGPLLL